MESLTEEQKQQFLKLISDQSKFDIKARQVLVFDPNPTEYISGVPAYFSYKTEPLSYQELLENEQSKSIRAFSNVFPLSGRNKHLVENLDTLYNENERLRKNNAMLHNAYSSLSVKDLQTQNQNQEFRNQVTNSFQAIYDRNVIVTQIEILLAQVKFLKNRVATLEDQLDQANALDRFEKSLIAKSKVTA